VSVSQILSSLGVTDGAASDGTLNTRINLHNVTQLRDLLDTGLSPEQRAQHADALLDGITAPADQPGVALLHRLVRHVVGNDELSQEDHAQLALALPITAHVTTQPPAAGTGQKDPGPGGTGPKDPGPGGTGPKAGGSPMQVNTVWDVSTPDGSLKVIDLPNGIELLDGGCIVARSTPLHFTCSSLTRVGGPPAGYSGDFNILGTTGAPVATPPAPPAPGQAPAGVPGQCSSAGIAGQAGGPGAPGQQGTAGAAGLRGHDGIASALASITITDSLAVDKAAKKLLVVATQSGPGGAGGDGGPGGTGQQGGNGGNGATCDCTGTGGGAAGPGGKGGTGGRAGDGGDGVDAAGNITVFVPKGTSTNLVQPVPSPAPPGKPGNPGPGGSGGPAGAPGAAGKHNVGGAAAGSGPIGDPGGLGNPGTHTGAAAQVTVTVF
jgi:hypothetical protein